MHIHLYMCVYIPSYRHIYSTHTHNSHLYICISRMGDRNGHVSEEPDAAMLFADRFLVWDHENGT